MIIKRKLNLCFAEKKICINKVGNFFFIKFLTFSIIKELTKIDLSKLMSFGNVSSNGSVALRGDVLLKCFRYILNTKETNYFSTNDLNTSDRKLLFQCQFNTCALDFYTNKGNKNLSKQQVGRLVFFKEEIDRIFAGIFYYFFLCFNNFNKFKAKLNLLLDETVDNQAAIELTFLLDNNNNSNNTTQKQKQQLLQEQNKQNRLNDSRFNDNNTLLKRATLSSQSANSNVAILHNQKFGIFSRVDSYENFDKSEGKAFFIIVLFF